MTGTLVLLSGGLDSATLLATYLRETPGPVHALAVDYGQRHRRELEAAGAVAAHYEVPLRVADLRGLGGLLRSTLTTDAGTVPTGHYAAENMSATVVPNRNAIMLMVAVGAADSDRLGQVATAVHAGDHPVYPDCRPEFVQAASAAAELATEGRVRIVAPFVHLSKQHLVSAAHRYGVPLDLTWSCYEGGEVHCGRCGTCVERAEAFHRARVPDPTTYADPAFWQEAVAR